ncbi:hypothetical protein CNBI2390 [Cryptococcus deneoformans B-3501A]|nr:hypothetical protein CNBI2390 [Cryptococcus neoformans var. neoformans B-3501A]EAL18978.1 hypothetical protein CNBI2390 [Cryptococcus neoformans var. neoformans B-3501A]
MNFQTPPGVQGNSLGPHRSLSSLENGQPGRVSGHSMATPSVEPSSCPGDQYQSFAQGIALSQASSSAINFQAPQPRIVRPSQFSTSQQYAIDSSPRQSQAYTSPNFQFHPYASQQYSHHPSPQISSPHTPADQLFKGKSPASSSSHSHSNLTPGSSVQPSHPEPLRRTSGDMRPSDDGDSGLSLDLSKFPRDVRFQVPSFPTNRAPGAPPAGSQAWTEYSNTSVQSSDASQTAPGGLFARAACVGGPAWTMAPDQGRPFGSNENAGWNRWDQAQMKQNGLSMGVGVGMAMAQMGTVYVNPNLNPAVYGQGIQSFPSNGYYGGQYNLQQGQHMQQENESGGGEVGSRDIAMNSPHQYAAISGPIYGPGPPSSNHFSSPGNPHLQPHTSPSSHRAPSPRPSHDQTHAPNMMSTSAILPQRPSYDQNISDHRLPHQIDFSSAASVSNPNPHRREMNFTLSSTTSYVHSADGRALLQHPLLSPAQQALQDGPGLYSTTGFDMLGILGRVAARKNPSMVIGPVDLSCSFVVVDIRRYDSPIVYASPNFTRLTGYELPQLLGRNCRFLQSPDGEVTKGSKREYTDNEAVYLLKRSLEAGKECQTSLINYRRNGEPFINLVTVVPIPWDGPDIVYHVGFQIDLVEQPNKILRNMQDGNYSVDYTYSIPPEKPLQLDGKGAAIAGLSTAVLDIMGSRTKALAAGTEEGARMEWFKMILDNTDDFIHALSLKGFFQYASSSIRRSLGYEPEDLLNKNISEFAHPSDIVPVIRALKDSTQTIGEEQQPKPVHFTFRIRTKNFGYVWVESMGRLVVEAGKGRKAVILSGRVRNMPTLSWGKVAEHGGLAKTEFWAKISFQGLLLNLTFGVDKVLGYQAEEILGRNLFSLLPGGQNTPPSGEHLINNYASAPDIAPVAKAIYQTIHDSTHRGALSIRQKMVHRSGQPVDVILVFYAPGQAKDKQSPISYSNNDESASVNFIGTPNGASTYPVKITDIFVQVKLLSSSPSHQRSVQPPSIASLTQARPLVHLPNDNIFEELETGRDSSWQYELHQMKMTNRRLRDSIAALKEKKAGKAKKRKYNIVDESPENQSEIIDTSLSSQIGGIGF